jgi:hypothetical protein
MHGTIELAVGQACGWGFNSYLSMLQFKQRWFEISCFFAKSSQKTGFVI